MPFPKKLSDKESKAAALKKSMEKMPEPGKGVAPNQKPKTKPPMPHAEPDADQMGGPSDHDADNMPMDDGSMPPGGDASMNDLMGGDGMAGESAGGELTPQLEEMLAQVPLEVLQAEVEKRSSMQGSTEEGSEAEEAGESPEQEAAEESGGEPPAVEPKGFPGHARYSIGKKSGGY